MIEMVKIGQKTENLFIGVNSGIMDQFVVGMGKKDHAILLDCNTLKYEYVPVILENEVIVISNTNKRRGLADSKYNERRSECEKALEELQTKLNIKALGELSIEEFEANKELISNEVNRKRAKHAVYENQRTLKAQKELSKGNLEEFGKLMNQSHESLRDDYEVTGLELDTLVELAWKEDGVIGSRMTGAGFGGCTVSIVKKDKVDDFIKNVGKKYKDKILDFSYKVPYTKDMNLKTVLTPETVNLHLKGTSKEEIIDELLDMLVQAGKVKDKAVARACVLDRERKMSTGMKHGIAIPHGKTDSVSDLVACIGISDHPVDFDSLDQEPCRIFIMTLSPIDKTGPHLQFLAEVSLLFKSAEKRQEILNATDKSDIIRILTE